jgi:hypothetical protein
MEHMDETLLVEAPSFNTHACIAVPADRSLDVGLFGWSTRQRIADVRTLDDGCAT